jgi:p-aminobenzoyl-glutamate transporter AbgT
MSDISKKQATSCAKTNKSSQSAQKNNLQSNNESTKTCNNVMLISSIIMAAIAILEFSYEYNIVQGNILRDTSLVEASTVIFLILLIIESVVSNILVEKLGENNQTKEM